MTLALLGAGMVCYAGLCTRYSSSKGMGRWPRLRVPLGSGCFWIRAAASVRAGKSEETVLVCSSLCETIVHWSQWGEGGLQHGSPFGRAEFSYFLKGVSS